MDGLPLNIASFLIFTLPLRNGFGYSSINSFRINRLKYIVNASIADGVANKVKIIVSADYDKFNAASVFIYPRH
ncbi:hypothetical protein D3C78_1525870 [compost metagenome]